MRVFHRGGNGSDWPPPGKVAIGYRPPADDPVPQRRRRAARSRNVALPGDHRAIPPSPGDGRKRSMAATRSSISPGMASSPTAGMPRSSARFAIAASISAEHLVTAIKNARSRPKVFVQGSAIGFYGPQGDEELTESSPSGTDFLAVVCRECEDVSRSIDRSGRPPGHRPDRHRAGSRRRRSQDHDPDLQARPGCSDRQRRRAVAKGDQWMSWIHLDDIVGDFQTGPRKRRSRRTVERHGPQPSAQRRIRQDFFERAQEAIHAMASLSAVWSPRRTAPARARRGGHDRHDRPTGPARRSRWTWVTCSNTPTLPMPCGRSSRRLRPQHPRSRTHHPAGAGRITEACSIATT